MKQVNTSNKFTPAQTPQACEIQKVALWVAGHIGTGMNAEDMIALREHLFALAEQVEETESALFSVAVAYTEGRGITMELLPVGGTA